MGGEKGNNNEKTHRLIMAFLHKTEYFKKNGFRHRIADHPLKIDIYDWRLMRYGEVKYGGQTGYGTLVFIPDSMFFVPNIGIQELMELNNKEKDTVLDTYFESILGVYFPCWCISCWGSGKTDWIQKISPSRKPKMQEAMKQFIRDETKMFIHPNSSNHIFSKTKINEAEEYCPRCNGFGYVMDGRFRLFKGVKKLKSSLQEITLS